MGHVESTPGRLFIEAGGNVLVSADDGVTWNLLQGLPLNGKPSQQVCPIVFTRIGARMLMGGECPLDDAWIGEGTLRNDLLTWISEPRRLALPLDNRNVHFFRDAGNGIVYAGIEGALLKSEDGGTTWRFVIRYPMYGGKRYPYVYHLLVTPQLLVAGGFDKKNLTGYLAYSRDGGDTWIDATALVGNADVELLAEDADGRPLIGLSEGATFTLAEQILGERGPRRRAAHP